MDPVKTFDLFPTFPTEIRLNIYSYASPHRILQVGYDFPFPFLPLPHTGPHPTDTLHTSRDPCLDPIRVSLPALFHVCHESRQLCLSTYIPFAYTYAHPHKDALYISSSASVVLSHNMNWYYKCARPPLYPLAELDRVAVEFDWLDLPSQGRETGGWLVVDNRRYLYSSPRLEGYLAAFAEFGLPKELLVVGGTGETSLLESSTQLRGWKTIQFVEDPNFHEPRRSEAVLQYIYDNLYYQREDVPWFRGRLSDVRIVGAEKEGESLKGDQEGLELLILSDPVAREWQKEEYELHGRDWDFSIDGSPYDKEHMKKALRGARAEIYMSGDHHAMHFTGKAPGLGSG